MIYSLTWLPSVMAAAGLKVAEVSGWQSRGRQEMGQVLGVICHDTVGALAGNMPSLQGLIDGRPGLPGPLAQLGLGRDGTFYVIAAGLCNHAGPGVWQGISTGNTNFIGIEAENTGMPNDAKWPEVQLDAYRRGVAAILMHIKRSVSFCAGHKEYATPLGRKQDPDFDMHAFRQAVSDIMSGVTPKPTLIPAVEPRASASGQAARNTLRRGDVDVVLVTVVQKAVGISPQDGSFGANTEAAVRVFQRSKNLVPDGIVGPKTWAALDAAATAIDTR